jgi:hypothetical protein
MERANSHDQNQNQATRKAYTAADFLKTLDNFFAEPASVVAPAEKQKVWDILTALRGPDDGDEGLKAVSTEVIRAKVFKRGLKAVNEYANVAMPTALIDWDVVNRADSSHFHSHIDRAAKALGL